MKRLLAALAAAVTLTSATAAQAWEFHGATVEGYGWHTFGAPRQSTYSSPGFSTHDLRASAQYDYDSTGVFVQPDVSLYAYNLSEFGGSIGAHAGYMTSPNMDVGAFAVYNHWQTWGDSAAFGIETAGTYNGNIHYDGYIATLQYMPLFSSWTHIARFDAMYDVNAASVGGGLAVWTSSWGENVFQARARVRHGFGSRFFAEGSYTYTNSSTGGVSHAIGVNIGTILRNGVTFGGRDYVLMHGGTW